MKIKEGVVDWFIRNLLVPNQEVIDKPGFIINKVSGKGKLTYLRDIVFPELLFEKIENKTFERYGESGLKKLYSAGKKFGLYYHTISNSPILQKEDTQIKNYVYFFVRYLEATGYGIGLTHEVDMDKKILKIKADEFIVCRHNGKNYIVGSGGGAGLWAGLTGDSNVEGVQTSCVGRGDDCCDIIYAPRSVLKEMGIPFFECNYKPDVKFSDSYMRMNEIRKTEFVKESLKSYIDFGLLKYRDGRLYLGDTFLYLCDANINGFIENELDRELLFSASREAGLEISKNIKSLDINQICSFLGACGWGDVLIFRRGELIEVNVKYAPWSEILETTNMAILSGYISGFLSYIYGDVKLRKIKKSTRLGFYEINFEWSL